MLHKDMSDYRPPSLHEKEWSHLQDEWLMIHHKYWHGNNNRDTDHGFQKHNRIHELYHKAPSCLPSRLLQYMPEDNLDARCHSLDLPSHLNEDKAS